MESKDRMKRVRVYLQGGLGNQCFAYATARALAFRTGADLELSLDHFEDDAVYHRKYELGNYHVAGMISKHRSFPVRFAKRLRYHLFSRMRCNGVLNYRCDYYPYVYKPLPKDWQGTLTLDGYWQSERYFYDQRDILLQDFRLKNSAWLAKDLWAEKIRAAACPVFVHVRSYKEVPGHTDGSMTIGSDFYKTAINYLRRNLGNGMSLFVFSDDLEWAKMRLDPCGLESLRSVEFVSGSSKGVDAQTRDFELIRMCHHGIVANSSFSRFAGWLGEQRNRAAGREPIYIHNSKKKNGYCPDRWIRIEAE